MATFFFSFHFKTSVFNKKKKGKNKFLLRTRWLRFIEGIGITNRHDGILYFIKQTKLCKLFKWQRHGNKRIRMSKFFKHCIEEEENIMQHVSILATQLDLNTHS